MMEAQIEEGKGKTESEAAVLHKMLRARENKWIWEDKQEMKERRENPTTAQPYAGGLRFSYYDCVGSCISISVQDAASLCVSKSDYTHT